jgi:hypothetical protein
MNEEIDHMMRIFADAMGVRSERGCSDAEVEHIARGQGRARLPADFDYFLRRYGHYPADELSATQRYWDSLVDARSLMEDVLESHAAIFPFPPKGLVVHEDQAEFYKFVVDGEADAGGVCVWHETWRSPRPICWTFTDLLRRWVRNRLTDNGAEASADVLRPTESVDLRELVWW